MSKESITVLIYHHQKLLDLITILCWTLPSVCGIFYTNDDCELTTFPSSGRWLSLLLVLLY
jgi:hypothetical protein